MLNLRTQLFRMWFRLSRPMTLGVRGVVENEQGEVLLVRHTYMKGLHFPGGGVERGEPVPTALGRELEEEGGVKLTSAPRLFGIYSNHHYFRNDHVLIYRIFWGDWEPCGEPIGLEISEIVWADPKYPPEDATDGTKRRLLELYSEAAVSDYW